MVATLALGFSTASYAQVWVWKGGELIYHSNNSIESENLTFSFSDLWNPRVSEGAVPATSEAVDLGLPSGTKWAPWNVGAGNASEYGSYFQWGETEGGKTSYDYDYTKYTSWDGKTTLEAEDDAATVNWGKEWCMPSKAQFQELIDECQWEWKESDSALGYLVTGPNGKTIFLPAAGYRYRRYSRSCYDFGKACHYWSSDLKSTSERTAAYSLDNRYLSSSGRAGACSVRPVIVPEEYVNVAMTDGDDGGFTAQDVTLSGSLTYVWSNTSTYGWTASGYASSTNNEAESWLVSPAYDLTNVISPVLTFDELDSDLNGDAVEDHFQILATANYTGDVTTTNWTDLTGWASNWSDATTWYNTNIGNISLSDFAGEANVVIALKYVSTSTSAPTFWIKNFIIKQGIGRMETIIWSGSFDNSGWVGNTDLAWGGYDWSTVEAGQTLCFYVKKSVAGSWGCLSLRNGNSWGALVDANSQDDVADDEDTATIKFTLTQGAVDDLNDNGGLVMTGDNLIITKVTIR